MSANNWDECPMCKCRGEEAKVKLEEQYGKVSQERYEELKKEFDDNKDKEYDGTPVREDYEIGYDTEGKAYVIYSASCQLCEFEREIRVEGITGTYKYEQLSAKTQEAKE